MKNGKIPTRNQSDIIRGNGLNPAEWLVIKNPSPDEIEIVSRVSLERKTNGKPETRKLFRVTV